MNEPKEVIIYSSIFLVIGFCAGMALGLKYSPKSTTSNISEVKATLDRSYEREDLWSEVAIQSVKKYGELSKNELGYNQRSFIFKTDKAWNDYGGTLNSDSSFGIIRLPTGEGKFYISGRIE